MLYFLQPTVVLRLLLLLLLGPVCLLLLLILAFLSLLYSSGSLWWQRIKQHGSQPVGNRQLCVPGRRGQKGAVKATASFASASLAAHHSVS
jgi:uncharacterized iron-regulated membrane protein